jgi:regulator of PEP synthase PpsR (kinase-PPPase family)
MAEGPDESREGGTPSGLRPVYLVSGGTGASGELLLGTVLAQFPGVQVPTEKRVRVQTVEAVETVVAEAAAAGGIVVHTLLAEPPRQAMAREAAQWGVPVVDLTGSLLERLSALTDRVPAGRPGLFRQQRQDYFDRVEAIEFTVAHDDGRRPEDLAIADVVLLGVSRCGKTPLSMYLAVHGWRVANVPLVSGIAPPEELTTLEPGRVVGLTIEHAHLIAHRRKRIKRLGVGPSDYTSAKAAQQELQMAEALYRRHGYPVVSVTDTPVETLAMEVLERIGAADDKRIVPP